MTTASPAQAAYDALAARYDETVAPSRWVRERLWERLDALFPPGARVLDVSAGTGLDALHLAARGVDVTACDLSPGMLARLRAKAPGLPTRVADLARLDEAGLEGPFDGILSTFAGLNAAGDLSGFAPAAARLLHPGGTLLLHVLNRWPLRECLEQLRHGHWPDLGPVRPVVLAGRPVPHRVWTPGGLFRAFAPHFERVGVSGQAVVRPADDPGPAGRRDRWERALADRALCRSLGTFFSLELRRRTGA
jgi:SAM-dependent methyltransferase